MTTKENIDFGKNLLKEHQSTLDNIELLILNKDSQKSIEFILEYFKIDVSSKIDSAKRKTQEYSKKYMLEYENISAAANCNMYALIYDLNKWIGKSPIEITKKIKPVIDSFETERDNLYQDQRNSIYLELYGHHNFLTKIYKANA